MDKAFITIAGREYRVEVNWNSLVAFLRAVDRDTLDELSHIETLRPSEITTLMAACIEEGERLEGRGGNIPSAQDLGALISLDDAADFLRIYVDQSRPRQEVKAPKAEAEGPANP